VVVKKSSMRLQQQELIKIRIKSEKKMKKKEEKKNKSKKKSLIDKRKNV